MWLTPSIVDTGLLQQIRQCRQRSLVVIGTLDPGYGEIASTRSWPTNITLTTIEGADHGLERPGDVTGSVGALNETIVAMAAWLDSNR